MEQEITTKTAEKELFVKMALSAWETHNERVDKLMNDLSEEKFAMEVAPKRNSGIYLIGHLAAVNDAMIPLLGGGEKLYPELEIPYLKEADKKGPTLNSIPELKKYWNEINSKLRNHFNTMNADNWFAPHNSVSAEDFAKEPHRNKLNIIINRTNHQSYHLGQLAFLK